LTAALFISVFLIAACGLIYELIAVLSPVIAGRQRLRVSTVIGCYLFAMGIGSFLSKYLVRGLVARFVSIELMVAGSGRILLAMLFLAFAYTQGSV